MRHTATLNHAKLESGGGKIAEFCRSLRISLLGEETGKVSRETCFVAVGVSRKRLNIEGNDLGGMPPAILKKPILRRGACDTRHKKKQKKNGEFDRGVKRPGYFETGILIRGIRATPVALR